MTTPQSAILPAASPNAIFLTLMIAPGEAAAKAVRRAAAGLPGLTAEVSKRGDGATLNSAIGFAAAAWDRLFVGARPAALAPFKALEDGPRKAPATPADILLHLHSDRMDLCFELVRRFRSALVDAVSEVEEVHGFRYFESRDLTGFVDGTENPQTPEHRAAVALVAEADPGFAGGSYVSVQRYIHDLTSWEKLSVAEQEQVFARTKADDVEFESDRKPPTAHIKRVNIKEDGRSVEILRHSMPYGTAAEMGLYFIAYGASPDNFDKMLEAMIVADGEGHYDHLMDYSRAVTGARFFVPAEDWLAGQG